MKKFDITSEEFQIRLLKHINKMSTDEITRAIFNNDLSMWENEDKNE